MINTALALLLALIFNFYPHEIAESISCKSEWDGDNVSLHFEFSNLV